MRRRHSFGHWPWYQTHSIAPFTYTHRRTYVYVYTRLYMNVCMRVCVSLYRISTCPNSSLIHLHHHAASPRHLLATAAFPSYFFFNATQYPFVSIAATFQCFLTFCLPPPRPTRVVLRQQRRAASVAAAAVRQTAAVVHSCSCTYYIIIYDHIILYCLLLL